MKRWMTLLAVLLACSTLLAQPCDNSRLPRRITVTSPEKSSHVQGIAVDVERGFAYFSFTTTLLKTDLQGRILASLTGLTCHLGCLELDRETGRLYASVEYKDDGIGRGLLRASGREASSAENSFYIAIIDTRRLTRLDMDAETSGVMRTVYLPEVVECYEQKRFGCSGIDGIALGPAFGHAKGHRRLYVDMALYGDTTRHDNDYQILLEFTPAQLERYARPLDQRRPHHSGPRHARRWLFAYTGNTAFGIQNLEYDPASRLWFAAVYKGSKSAFPNYTLFALDGRCAPRRQSLLGIPQPKRALVLSLAPVGERHAPTGITGWHQNVGSTGIESLGNGLFYLSRNARDAQGYQSSTLHLSRYLPLSTTAFSDVED